ncbi:Cystathionine beta-lyase PatB [Serratia entomophila]|uniref:cysteine-S-conjugate beta-lyase n=1 Tax=Serratia entomophila TaxID=42906 RepID=A0ABY5CM80_9GAMM|nr:PatB family C-S lyase [Serratia entomophila]UIW16516.1 PatB family C-S lyase [Serratia entomophila]USU99072.1 PatB family C-S lyase [Serratia entomophila]CAI1103338.1 Cystathionine beta-lyase PatB [Serratia entomophila]CAI1108773.1 Cystathionine beta-lyase PatB [Serratia entomophila]CAI1111080.1 Cystathionine beta-lyase PatB [Serratia entomophila]
MAFNFDQWVDRSHSDSVKWDKYRGRDIIPLWVADSDFQSPPAVIEALRQRVAHGVFGYSHPSHDLVKVFTRRMVECYGWHIKPEWIIFLPGLVCGLNLCVRAFSAEGEATLAPTPIYPPFRKAARFAGRRQLPVPLALVGQRWLLDLPAVSQRLEGDEKLLLLCNPQNPGGTAYRREELLQHHDFARRHDWVVCSDEIHCDLLLEPGAQHIPFATLNADAAQRSITLMSPSKTFNLAGLGASMAIIPNDALRKKLQRARSGIVPEVDLLALVAAQAAYQHGQAWLDAQLIYLRANRDLVFNRINAMPGLRLHPVEASYLAWIDCSELPVDNPHAFFEQAGVGLSAGLDFGDRRFVRLNFGCRRALLEEALSRMAQACAALSSR